MVHIQCVRNNVLAYSLYRKIIDYIVEEECVRGFQYNA